MTPVTALLLGVACAYGVVSGFNDGGNLLASFTSARVIRPRGAFLLLLAVPLGPLLLGTTVARTVGRGIIDLPAQGQLGFVLITLTAITVVLISWRLRVPTSMTLALVGAMVGWAVIDGDARIRWSGVARVLIGMPLSVLAGGALAFLLYRLVRRVFGRLRYGQMLRVARFQVLAAGLQAFAYGGNDLEKTMGLVAVARTLPTPPHQPAFDDALPLLTSFGSFLLGTVLGGWRVARRVGFGVVPVRPVAAFTEQLAAGSVVASFGGAGIPISTTQTVAGALVGVGVGWRASAVRWGVVREMLGSWLVTLPLALIVAVGVHVAVRLLGAGP